MFYNSHCYNATSGMKEHGTFKHSKAFRNPFRGNYRIISRPNTGCLHAQAIHSTQANLSRSSRAAGLVLLLLFIVPLIQNLVDQSQFLRFLC